MSKATNGQNTPEVAAAEQTSCRQTSRAWLVAQMMATLPARTMPGLVAKARAARWCAPEWKSCPTELDLAEFMAFSVVNDLAALWTGSPDLGEPSSADAHLVALAHEYERLYGFYGRVSDLAADVDEGKANVPFRRRLDSASGSFVRQMNVVAGSAALVPATTLLGFAAKAQIIHERHQHSWSNSPMDMDFDDMLVRALLEQLMAAAGVKPIGFHDVSPEARMEWAQSAHPECGAERDELQQA